MEQTRPVLGNGIRKNSARQLVQFVDEKGNTWICDRDAMSQIDPTRPFEEQNIAGGQVIPFDHGG